MKNKIVGIVILMLVATTVVSATNINVKKDIQPTASGADVPVWAVGDSWTYEENQTCYNYDTHGNITFIWNFEYTSTYTVTKDIGDNYILKMTAKNVKGNFMWGPTKIKFTRFTKVTNEYQLRKTDLAQVSWTDVWKGFVFWLRGNIGLPIPAQMYLIYDYIYTPPQVYTPFPLIAGTNGTIPNTHTHANTTCSLYWGLIPVWGPAEVNMNTGILQYTCEMANITVPADTYNAYNVTEERFYGASGHDYYRSYYVPEVGNVAKRSFHQDWDSTGRLFISTEMKLVSTTYTP